MATTIPHAEQIKLQRLMRAWDKAIDAIYWIDPRDSDKWIPAVAAADAAKAAAKAAYDEALAEMGI